MMEVKEGIGRCNSSSRSLDILHSLSPLIYTQQERSIVRAAVVLHTQLQPPRGFGDDDEELRASTKLNPKVPSRLPTLLLIVPALTSTVKITLRR
jgi:hypothetical protein